MPPSMWTRFLFVLLPIVTADAASDYAQGTSKSPRGDVAAALADSARPDWDKERDADRKPIDVLVFAGVKRGDRIADIYPGRGYYSRILSNIVGPSGHVYAVIPGNLAKEMPQAVTDTTNGLSSYGNISVLVAPFAEFAMPEPLDVVWMSQVYHDLPNIEMGPADIPAMNKAILTALKPGGLYVVTDHSAGKGSGFLDTEPDMKQRKHRIDPDIVKTQVLAAGFVLEAESAVLANAGDSHEKSVFDPTIRGKTDQFLLKFRKPATPAAQITFSGRYAGDEGASKMPAGTHVPPEFIYAIEDEGTVVHLLQTFRGQDGKVQRNEWRGPVDGKPHPAISESPHSLALSRTPHGDLIITGFSADGSKQDDEICSLLEDRRGFTCRDLNTTSKHTPPKYLYMFKRID